MVTLLSKALEKYVGNVAIACTVLSAACYLLAYLFASQILTPFGNQVQTISTGLNSTTTTSILGLTATATCSISPCTIDVTMGEHVGITEFITGTVSHVIPTIQKQATQNLINFLVILGTVLAFLTVAIVARRKLRRR